MIWIALAQNSTPSSCWTNHLQSCSPQFGLNNFHGWEQSFHSSSWYRHQRCQFNELVRQWKNQMFFCCNHLCGQTFNICTISKGTMPPYLKNMSQVVHLLFHGYDQRNQHHIFQVLQACWYQTWRKSYLDQDKRITIIPPYFISSLNRWSFWSFILPRGIEK